MKAPAPSVVFSGFTEIVGPTLYLFKPNVEGDVEHHTPISGDDMTGAGDGGAELAAGQILLVGSQPRILSHVSAVSDLSAVAPEIGTGVHRQNGGCVKPPKESSLSRPAQHIG